MQPPEAGGVWYVGTRYVAMSYTECARLQYMQSVTHMSRHSRCVVGAEAVCHARSRLCAIRLLRLKRFKAQEV